VKKHLFLLLLIFFASIFINAQEPLSIHLTEKDGLPDIEFYDLLEDDNGIIWLAADKGLYKYNGRTYELLEHPLKRGRSLFSLKKDEKGRIWCNNLAGQFFYIENDKLILFKNFEEINTLVDFYLFKNHLIVFYIANIKIVDITTKKTIRTLYNTEGINTEMLNKEFKNFYFSSNNEIFKIDNLDQEPEFISKIIRKNNFIRCKRIGFKIYEKEYVFEQNEQELLINIVALHKDKNISIKFPKYLNGIQIHKIVVFRNQLFMLSNKGVYLATINNNTLIIKNKYFINSFLTDVILDNNNNYWFSTLNNGIFIVTNNELKNYNNLLDKIVLTEKKNANTLFLANDNGFVFEYQLNTNKLRKLKYASNTPIKTFFFNADKENLIIGSSNFTANYNLKKDKADVFKNLGAIKSIDFIKNDTYLLSTPNDFSELNLKTKKLNPIVSKRSYAALFSEKENKYYATMIDGFLEYNLKDKKATYILYNNKRIYASKLAKLANGSIWIATHNKGLLNLKNNVFVDSLVLENGLASNVISQIKAHKNELWIATDKGLQKYNSKNKSLQTLTKADGLNSYAIDHITILDSLLFLTTNKGLLSFNEYKVFKNRKVPALYFTNLIVNDSIQKNIHKIEVTEQESDFRIEFNNNGFQSNENTIYEYLLEGFSTKWIVVDEGINFVNFNTLPAGTFTFKLRAKNKYDAVYSDEITLPIQVNKPFYKTFLFLSLLIFLVVLLIYIYFKKQNSRLQKEQNIALEKANISKELVFSQLENLRSQMNPHFIFNALNSIQDFIILNEKKLARQYLVKFSKLIRIYLEHSQQNEVTLVEEIKALQLYLELEKDRFNDDFKFHISIDENLKIDQILIPSLLLQPYVENALKHGLLHKLDNKKLLISFLTDKNSSQLICVIEDNGIGRIASAEINKKKKATHTSFATSANQKRINLLNLANNTNLKIEIQDLYEAEIASGTKITIKIPLK
tara:strand:- start:4047 stop:6950 length:2904 start_codon:yes stop_codon:yes gene_type:complete